MQNSVLETIRWFREGHGNPSVASSARKADTVRSTQRTDAGRVSLTTYRPSVKRSSGMNVSPGPAATRSSNDHAAVSSTTQASASPYTGWLPGECSSVHIRDTSHEKWMHSVTYQVQ